MEEGKLEAMLKGLEEAEKKNEKEEDKKEDKKDTVANNVIAYLDLKEGGHRRYGTGFLVSQVKYFISGGYVFLQ
jgi:hypothetical protein